MVIIEMKSSDTPMFPYCKNGTIEHSAGYCSKLMTSKNLDAANGKTATQNNRSAAPKLQEKEQNEIIMWWLILFLIYSSIHGSYRVTVHGVLDELVFIELIHLHDYRTTVN